MTFVSRGRFAIGRARVAFGVEAGRLRAGCEVCRDLPRCTARSTITSTRSAPSSTGRHSRIAEPPLWLSGGTLARPEEFRGREISEIFQFALTAPTRPLLPPSISCAASYSLASLNPGPRLGLSNYASGDAISLTRVMPRGPVRVGNAAGPRLFHPATCATTAAPISRRPRARDECIFLAARLPAKNCVRPAKQCDLFAAMPAAPAIRCHCEDTGHSINSSERRDRAQS